MTRKFTVAASSAPIWNLSGVTSQVCQRASSGRKNVDERHDDAVDHGGHDLAKGGAEDHGDGQVDDVAASDELLELFDDLHFSPHSHDGDALCDGQPHAAVADA
jgi:hypothetical protein